MTAEDALTKEEQEKLTHMRALVSMKCELTDKMMEEYQSLEAREKKMLSAKTLSHGHINKHHKLEAQVQAAKNKIQAMDQEWASFIAKAVSKVQHHYQLYQTCRADLMESLNAKVADLIKVKQEVAEASQSMISQPGHVEDIQDAPDAADAMEMLQKLAEDARAVEELTGVVNVDDEMEEEQEAEMPAATETTKKGPKLQPFRQAGSPVRVASTHLKVKPVRTNTWGVPKVHVGCMDWEIQSMPALFAQVIVNWQVSLIWIALSSKTMNLDRKATPRSA